MTRYELWAAILATSIDLGREVAAEVGDLPNRGPSVGSPPPRTTLPQLQTAWRDLPSDSGGGGARAMSLVPHAIGEQVGGQVGERDRSGLVTLAAKVGVRVSELWADLEGEPGFDRIRRALVIYFDEQVMSVLPEYLRLSWPLLQKEFTGSTAGGDDFYRFIDDALEDRRAPSLVFEVYYFCLRHGFRGRYTGELARIAEYERRLLDKIEIETPGASVSEREEVGELGKPWPTWAYYVVAGLFVIGFCVVLTLLTNYPSESTPEPAQIAGGRS